MSQQRVVDNPNDIAIREQQRAQRLEMGKAHDLRKGVEPITKEYSKAYTFRFRQIKNSQFSGLWELCVLDKNGKVEERITDADSLSNALEAIGNIFDNAGY